MIRLAAPADAGPITEVQSRAWRRAYADIVPPDALEPEAVEARMGRWSERLAAGAQVLVWDQDGRVAGFCAVGPASAREEPPAGEIHAMYVEPAAQGAGIGSALLGAGEGWLAEDLGVAEAVLWVFEANAPARRFYERRGWRLEPEDAWRHLHGKHWWAPAVRYRRALR